MPESRQFLLLAPGFLLLTSCGPKNFNNENDKLRRENLQLTRQVEALQTTLNDRLGQIETLHARLGDPDSPDSPDAAERPVPSGLTIDSYSGPVDLDRDGHDDALRLYLLPTDQRGRMIPVAGSLTAYLLHLPDTGDPVVLRTFTLGPAALDDAYRDGFTGPYYRAEFSLADLKLPGEPIDELTVRVVLQPLGAAPLRDQRAYRVRLAHRPAEPSSQ